MSEPKQGETWHVRLSGATALTTYFVKEVTVKTVLLKTPRYGTEVRLVKDDVEFVERA